MIEDPQEVLIHPGMNDIQGQSNWEVVQNNLQQMVEIHLAQPIQPQPIVEEVEEVAENVVEVAPIHLNEENNFLPLEIQEDDLMNDDETQQMEAELNMDWQQGQQAQPDNIHIGMVRIIDRFYPNIMDHDIQTANNGLLIKQAANVSDKVLANSFLHPEKASNTTLIEVPKKWADFFKVLLSSPTSYSWAIVCSSPSSLPSSCSLVKCLQSICLPNPKTS